MSAATVLCVNHGQVGSLKAVAVTIDIGIIVFVGQAIQCWLYQ